MISGRHKRVRYRSAFEGRYTILPNDVKIE